MNVKRQNKSNDGKLDPAIVPRYNKYMKGTDIFDQQTMV